MQGDNHWNRVDITATEPVVNCGVCRSCVPTPFYAPEQLKRPSNIIMPLTARVI